MAIHLPANSAARRVRPSESVSSKSVRRQPIAAFPRAKEFGPARRSRKVSGNAGVLVTVTRTRCRSGCARS